MNVKCGQLRNSKQQQRIRYKEKNHVVIIFSFSVPNTSFSQHPLHFGIDMLSLHPSPQKARERLCRKWVKPGKGRQELSQSILAEAERASNRFSRL